MSHFYLECRALRIQLYKLFQVGRPLLLKCHCVFTCSLSICASPKSTSAPLIASTTLPCKTCAVNAGNSDQKLWTSFPIHRPGGHRLNIPIHGFYGKTVLVAPGVSTKLKYQANSTGVLPKRSTRTWTMYVAPY